MKGRLLRCVLLLAFAAGAFANQQNIAKGFSVDKAYELNELDAINTFSGNLTVAIPIGMRYSAGGGLSYQFVLSYGGKAVGRPGNLIDAPYHMGMLPPPGVRMAGMYHTHGADNPNYADEAMSHDDRRTSYTLGLAGYVGTPSGRVLRYDPQEAVLRDPHKYDFGHQIGTVPCR